MKKLIAIFLAIVLILTMTLPVSAATFGVWDLDAGADHARETAWRIVQDDPESVVVPWWAFRWLEWFVIQKN